jgi:hypothetical protein
VSYRFARRSFLAGIGGAVGLKIMLRNIEATAAGAPAPPRFLMAYWPNGTVKYYFHNDRILKPFVDAGLGGDMVSLYGLNANSIPGYGGGEERGTVTMTTGAAVPGTRMNGGESDDAVAGGPSFDQIFLKHVPALQRAGGPGSASVLCDARVDSFETSAQCLSYDYATRSIPAAMPSGTTITENIPRLPFLKPIALYAQLFAGFAPGTPGDDRMTNLLRARKSVLDHSQRELVRLRSLVPAGERVKIDAHAEAIRKVERQLSTQISGTTPGGSCTAPSPSPSVSLEAKTGSKNDYRAVGQLSTSPSDDTPSLEQLATAYMAVIRAAFQCDIIRVATFQWASANSHVAFKGMHPADPTANVMYHPATHHITDPSWVLSAPPTGNQYARDTVEFLANVMTWFNQKLADVLVTFKTATDVYGGNLLRQTVIPYVTDMGDASHQVGAKPALIFGGAGLGMRGGQSLTFSPSRPQNDLWATVAQAYLGADALAALAGEKFVKTGVAPIPDLWRPVV